MSKANRKVAPKKVTDKNVTDTIHTNLEENDITDSKFINLDKLEFKTEAQEKYWKLIGDKEIILCSGPAGTGKSYISLARALQIFSKERKKYKKIIIVKPVVEADEKLGYLPGSIEEKLEPYIFSTKYILEKILGKAKIEALFSKGKLEVMALAYMRGINIDNSIVVCEEAQNMTPKQMKTLLTRIGENSKFIISGDHEQSDRYKNSKETGLYFAMNKLKGLVEIGQLEFEAKDIVRNPIIGKILEKFNGDV
jgi:phosphate starvation-inducible PhoH-like protein